VLDLPGLQAWLASRPPKPFELPTLSRGLQLREGAVRADGWRLSGLDLELPHLQAGTERICMPAARCTRAIRTCPSICRLAWRRPAWPRRGNDPAVAAGRSLPRKPASRRCRRRRDRRRGQYAWAEPRFRFDAAKLAVTGNASIPSFEGNAHVQLAKELACRSMPS
jgi:hypothetical protein